MIVSVDIGKIEQLYKDKIVSALKIVSNQLATEVQDRVRKNKSIVTGNLVNSIQAKQDDSNLSATVSTNVIYAPRVEFGFVGKDSLGRYYNQAPKSFMRSVIEERRDNLIRLFAMLMKRL